LCINKPAKPAQKSFDRENYKLQKGQMLGIKWYTDTGIRIRGCRERRKKEWKKRRRATERESKSMGDSHDMPKQHEWQIRFE